MYSPNLKEPPQNALLTDEIRLSIKAEVSLMNSNKEWLILDEQQSDSYKELAMIYSAMYSDKIAISDMLLTFHGAVIQMEVDRFKYEERNGVSDKTVDLMKRNQMLIRVHKEVSDLLERNQQMVIMIRNLVDQNSKLRELAKSQQREIEAVKNAFQAA